MRSFILEYKRRAKKEEKEQINSSNDVGIDIHINLWKSTGQDKMSIFDFGFMISDIERVDEIILYCPFKIEKVEDLGETIIDSKTTDAIFNERCAVEIFYPKRCRITKKGEYTNLGKKGNEEDEKSFILYSLNEDQLEAINEKDREYSKIRIKTDTILTEDEKDGKDELKEIKEYYFRIRIFTENGTTSIIKRENEKANILQDVSFRTTEIIDFRINDLRSSPNELKEEFLRTPRFKINQVHYLIIRDSTDEFIEVGDSKVTSRILEKEIWNGYTKTINIGNSDKIAYHIKKKGDISTFSYLARFKYPSNILPRALKYIFIGLVLSIFYSFAYDILKLSFKFLL